ncbi:group III truncated hemoglobin [Nitratireductor sp. XY-223]|uniref:group III truncated hemoglobin n=1 Tax=Nitratireductor sp. XY-223 TaxID=2561926 RepID=UPI0010AAF228|nr:group III truncated hemoglobin [Nitratireductor sp. XY-223]
MNERRAKISREITERTGITEALIERLVRRFYDRVRTDPLLGPVFADRITDWEPHLQQMFAFWSSVALLTGRYHGRPMQKHAPLPVSADHFDRWLALFEATAREVCTPAAAEHFVERARNIAQSLEMGIAQYQGVLLAPGERLQDRSTPPAGPAAA